MEFEGARSETLGLEMGVPEGSILGPLLFMIYVNDMHTVSNKFTYLHSSHKLTTPHLLLQWSLVYWALTIIFTQSQRESIVK